jgi:DNA-binding beta-propeller fold protein YncE
MSTRLRRLSALSCCFLGLLWPQLLHARGARLFKSGPIQVTADGRWVWTANQDNDSVSRLDTSADSVLEVALPDPATRDSPRGLSVREDGAEVWVACHDSDRLYVLAGADGAVISRVDLPWGSGPFSVALSRDQRLALVTLHRAAALALIDTTSREVTQLLEPVYWSPMGIAWTEDGRSAWVTHLFAEGEHPYITRVVVDADRARVKSRLTIFATDPRQSSRLAAPQNIAEGGYLTIRGHPAQVPSASGRSELWLPVQYNNISEDVYSPDSTVQATIRRINLATRVMGNANTDKVILTAVHVHDPAAGNAYVGPGWNASISGPIDLAFSSNGATTYYLCELSGELVVLPTDTPAVKPAGAQPLAEIRAGERPTGLAVSPTSEVAYVYNQLSRDVSVIDLEGLHELRRIAVTPVTGEPLPPSVLAGARIFHSSADPRLSGNQKVACGSCHLNGEHDGRDWAFHRLPGEHGPRSVQSLLGLGRTFGPRDPASGFGQLHLSGDRDEVQDFEHTFRSVLMGGIGFLGDAVQPELGPPNAGLSAELDALADYLLYLPPVLRSPRRLPDGSLSEAAVRGATFFAGANRAAKPADSGCAACHVPETGFVDFRFHDVGQRRSSNERELSSSNRPAAWRWKVNTQTLVGVWTSPPYGGVAGYAVTVLDVLKDQAARARSATPHGTPDGLVGRQLLDLQEFVLSIDGDMTADEVRSAQDIVPPRVVRVEPASLTTVDVWFSEAVDALTAADPSRWRLTKTSDGSAVAVQSALRDGSSGDRVTLRVALETGCAPIEYELAPTGVILDLAGTASGGAANALDLADPANTRRFTIGSTLTVTLGASSAESIVVPVHDASMVGPNLSTWSHDSVWLFSTSGGPGVNTGFVRFDWQSAFAAVTGVTSPDQILDASFSLQGEYGDAQTVEVRRVLQSWSDSASGGDWNQNANGAPTWRDHAHPSAPWNSAGAASLGGTGSVASDYNSSRDLASRVDASVAVEAVNERVTFAGPLVTDAFRFWFESPALDYGYALRLLAGTRQGLKLERSEAELREHGPVLTITYRLPGAVAPEDCKRTEFHRGDPDQSGEVDLTDAVVVFRFLFLGGTAPSCLESADSNNDAAVDLSDGIHVLNYLFLGGEPPALPGPVSEPCGTDPDPPGSPGDLGCESYGRC